MSERPAVIPSAATNLKFLHFGAPRRGQKKPGAPVRDDPE
jgi:hypothetical protein